MGEGAEVRWEVDLPVVCAQTGHGSVRNDDVGYGAGAEIQRESDFELVPNQVGRYERL